MNDAQTSRAAVAFGLVLHALGIAADPADIDQRLPGTVTFETLPELYSEVRTTDTSTEGLPDNLPAIVRLADDNLYFMDSHDTVVDGASYVKQSLSLMPDIIAWASYGLTTPAPPPPPDDTPPAPARKLPTGSLLNSPHQTPVKAEKRISYILLYEPRIMHVSRPGGARKQRFGNVRKWSDVTMTGPTHPEHKNITIVMEAYVPIGDEKAKYYMDALSVGDYLRAGRVAYTTGFNHSHLTDGAYQPAPVAPPKPAPKPEPTVKLIDITPKPSPNKYKSTYEWLNADGTSRLYTVSQPLPVRDIDERRPTYIVYKTVDIQGTFIWNGTTYGRPADAALAGIWYGIPMQHLQAAYNDEDTLITEDVPLVERIERGKLAPEERYLTVPLSRILSQYVRLKHLVSKTHTKEPKL